VLWACLTARLLFYATMLPFWEGYDEWAHFAVIRHVAAGEWLVARNAPVADDIQASLRLAPVPWEMRGFSAPLTTEDVFWTLSPQERASREAEFARGASGGGPSLEAYEALQPPLYYWLMAPVVRVLAGAGLAWQVLSVRWLSVLVASLTVPLVFRIGRDVFLDDHAALGCAAVVAVMPGFALDVARVANDSLAVVLFTMLIALGFRRGGWGLGVVLGLGLLTKAYFLAGIPAVLLFRRHRNARVLLPVAIGAWWYARNLWTTGTLAGLSESVMLRGTGWREMARAAVGLPWGKAIDAILFSHLYFGGWSSLTVRSWMYHVFYAVVIVAAIGLARGKRPPGLAWLAAVYGAFWAAQLYNVLLLYVSKGLPGSMGWYLYAVVGAEVVLCAAGFGRWRAWAAAGGATLFALLDLYTVHLVEVPYYTGLIRHRANGTVAALHWAEARASGWGEVITRLAAFRPVAPWFLVTTWMAYLAATLCVVVLAWRRGARQN
jgi:hypothetical protein